MRRHEPLSPEAVRELAAIDRSLAGETVDYDLREIDDLVRDVRASAPQMSPALSARLERGIEGGFAGPEGAAKPAHKWTLPRMRVLAPAMGTLAAVLVALVVVAGQNDSSPVGKTSNETATAKKLTELSGNLSQDSAASAPTAQRPPAALPRASKSASGNGPVFSTPGAASITPSRARKVERKVSLVLSTPQDKVESTSDDVIQTVDRFRGIVASSSINTDDSSGSEATFDLRIPTSRLDAALAELSKLGHVAERRQDLQDITASFTSTQDRLDNARAERKGILRALGKATTQTQIDSLRSRLRLVSGQIAAAKSQLSTLSRRANLSTVNVTVRGDGKAKHGGGGWSLGDAGGDAVRALEVIAGVALITIAIALPLSLLGAAILFGARMGRTRRRENALDAT
jgi:Domain of unknown function (DUF4349)